LAKRASSQPPSSALRAAGTALERARQTHHVLERERLWDLWGRARGRALRREIEAELVEQRDLTCFVESAAMRRTRSTTATRPEGLA